MKRIFISYRRDDAKADARGLRDRLAQQFGAKNIFMDVDNLLVGQRFDQELEKALKQCDVFLAIIGPRWMELLSERRASGERDYVREEITAALKRGAIVIPVLVDGAPIPQANALPEELRELALYQALSVSHAHYGRDVFDLIKGIEAQTGGGTVVGKVALATLLIGIVGAFGTYFYHRNNAQVAERELVKIEATKKYETQPKAERAVVVEEKRKAEEVARKRAEFLRPGRTFRDCPNCPEMVVIPAGSFLMGSPTGEADRQEDEETSSGSGGSQLRVTIPKPFAMGKYVVTFDEWDACVMAGGCNGYKPKDEGWGRGNRPVINVSMERRRRHMSKWLSQ